MEAGSTGEDKLSRINSDICDRTKRKVRAGFRTHLRSRHCITRAARMIRWVLIGRLAEAAINSLTN